MLNTHMLKITATLVPDEKSRLSVLHRHFDSLMMDIQSVTYFFMRGLCSDYSGGFWDFFELSNGGFLMAPRSKDGSFTLRVKGNGFEGSLSDEAAGIVALMFSLGYCWESGQLSVAERNNLVQHRMWLHDFIDCHHEREAILAALD